MNVKTKSQDFRYELNDLIKSKQVSDLIKLCETTLSSEIFKVNSCERGSNKHECTNMCDILPKMYGNELI